MRQPFLAAGAVITALVTAACGRAPAIPPDGAGEPAAAAVIPRGDSLRTARQAILRQITEADTYLPAMLAAGDSILRRWPPRLDQPLRVYLPASSVIGYRLELGQGVRDAFARWQRVGDIPVTFRLVRDSTGADVVVRWVHTFPLDRAGQADVRWRGDGWIQSGTLTLATANHRGAWFSPDAVYTVALHEIGHLLGLGHSDDPRDVMYPTTDVHDITPRDRRTARLLYAVPPGSLRLP